MTKFRDQFKKPELSTHGRAAQIFEPCALRVREAAAVNPWMLWDLGMSFSSPATPVGKATRRSRGANHLLGSTVTGSE